MRLAPLLLGSVLFSCISDVPNVPDGGDSGPAMEGGGSDGGDAGPNTMMVSGTVIDEFGQAMPNVNVGIGSAQAKTDAMGTFKLPATTPYDVNLVSTTSIGHRVTSFQGLKSASPFLQIFQSTAHKATVNITISPWGGSWATNQRVFITLTPTEAASDAIVVGGDNKPGLNAQNGAGPTFNNLSVSWTGASSISGTAYAYNTTVNPMTNMPVSPLASGSGQLMALADGASTSITLTMSIFPQSFPTNVNVDANGTTLNELDILLRPGANAKAFFEFDNTSFSTAGMVSWPTGPVGTSSVWVQGVSATSFNNTWKTGLTINNSAPTLKIPDSITAMTPMAMATGVDATTAFSWSALAGTAYDTHVVCGTTYELDIITLGTTAHIPDTNALGSGLPPTMSCGWQVKAFSGVTQESDITGVGGWVHFANFYKAGADGWNTISKLRVFTSK